MLNDKNENAVAPDVKISSSLICNFSLSARLDEIAAKSHELNHTYNFTNQKAEIKRIETIDGTSI